MKKNNGRSETLRLRPERQYLSKGLIRNTYCCMPMRAQTYKNELKYYREIRTQGVRESALPQVAQFPDFIDDHVRQLVGAIELLPRWLGELLSIISLKDEVHR